MSLGEQLQRTLDILAQEIRHKEDDRLVRQHLDQVVRGAGDVGAGSLGLEHEEIANDAQGMASPFAGRYDVLDVVGE